MTSANSAIVGPERNAPALASRVLLIGKDPQVDRTLEEGLKARNCIFDYAAGSADALRHLRETAYAVVVTDPATSIEEDLALVLEMRAIRPGVRAIVLAPCSTPEEVIAALRARVFVCKSAPFDGDEIADYAAQAGAAADSLLGIEVLSAHRDWVSLRVNCQLLSAERLIAFLKELRSELPEAPREELMSAFREILMNAMEHGAKFQSGKVVEVAAVHTARSIVFYVKDPGAGFRWETLQHAAISNPSDPTSHAEVREQMGLRPGGFGILMARGIVNELIYSEAGNEVLLIKHLS
jgi:ActR/RegA family two-component response regulator/anti-sigma regulatory factor (Ser/Thr protein kinase)